MTPEKNVGCCDSAGDWRECCRYRGCRRSCRRPAGIREGAGMISRDRVAAAVTFISFLILSSGISLAGEPLQPAQDHTFFFRDGDRVVMMGDSITEQLLYSNYVETWVLTRFPAWDITFRNIGINGDTATGGNRRFERDVPPLKATAMTIDFGMNDGGYAGFSEPHFKQYVNNLQGMADQARKNNIRVAWLTPQPFEKPDDGPAIQSYAGTLEKFAEGVKTVAAKNSGAFVDQFHPYLDMLNKARAENPKNRIGGGDPIHPGPPGQAGMASAILKGLNFPALVSSAEIDAKKNAVIKAEQCQISDIGNGTNGGIIFTRLDAALPFFPEQSRAILKWAPILEDMNRYMLKVTGLKAGQYEVRLGGKKIAEYADTALAEGVNLAQPALTNGPVARQVRDVVAAIQAKNKFFHDRAFRGVTLAQIVIPDFVPEEGKRKIWAEIGIHREAAFKKMMDETEKYEQAVKASLVIKPHLVEVVPVAPTENPANAGGAGR